MKQNLLRQVIVSLFFVCILIAGCNSEDSYDCENSEVGFLKDYSALDACGWIIQLSDSSKLEPINLDDFEIELNDNKRVCVRYNERQDVGSYCMVGKVVELVSIE